MEIRKSVLNPLHATQESSEAGRNQDTPKLELEGIAGIKDTLTDASQQDLGVTLIEEFAYVADQLSSYQDAIASEGQLETESGLDNRLRQDILTSLVSVQTSKKDDSDSD